VTRPREGAPGCLRLLIILALLAWPILVLSASSGWDATGGLLLTAGALLALDTSRRGHAGTHRALEPMPVGIRRGLAQPRAAAPMGGPTRHATALLRGSDRIEPGRDDEHRRDTPAGGRPVRDTRSSNPPGFRAGTSIGESVWE
jgi:hypothetical protein